MAFGSAFAKTFSAFSSSSYHDFFVLLVESEIRLGDGNLLGRVYLDYEVLRVFEFIVLAR